MVFFFFFFFKISSSVQLQEWHFLYIADIKKIRKFKIQTSKIDDYYAKPIFCVDLTFKKAMKSVENKEKERFH
jgi:hypothetical protein